MSTRRMPAGRRADGRAVQENLDGGNAVARDRPAVDRQHAPDGLREGALDDRRRIYEQPKVVDGAFDAPVRRMLAIEGWAIARHGVAAVEAFLDGVLVSVASPRGEAADIGASYPDWPDSLISGYAIVLPRKVFSKDRHVLRIVARDRARGSEGDRDRRSRSSRSTSRPNAAQLRGFVTEAEIALKRALIDAAPPPPVFAAFILAGGEEGALAQTLESLAAQAYPRFRAGLIALDARRGRGGDGGGGRGGSCPAHLRRTARRRIWPRRPRRCSKARRGRPFLLMLRAGDRLGADALLEFALDIVTRPEEDFHYADDSRHDPLRDRAAEFLKPEWSPDLLLSTNYIGRAWCAALGLCSATPACRSPRLRRRRL